MTKSIAAAAALALFAGSVPARAEVARIEITSRSDVGSSGYEKLVGRVYFAVDSKDPHNRIVVDLDNAPTNGLGRVDFSADVYILRPKTAASNRALLLDILNRGGKPLLTGFNRATSIDPATDGDLGDPFLMRQGFTLAWVGWEFDIPNQPGLMKIDVPVATNRGAAITGLVHATFTAAARTTDFDVTDLLNYDAVDPDGPDGQLTMRTAFLGQPQAIPRAKWHIAGHKVSLDGGFAPGATYEITYRAAAPRVAGLGFVAVRDFAAFMKHPGSDAALLGLPDELRYAYTFGSSQSGRFLRDFLYEGFNTDEKDRQVFDGVLSHIAGASRIDLNARWSTPRGLGVHSATAFPFADAAMTDPVSGARDGLLENARVKHAPKVFYTNTPVEYWGTGRVAALIHTDPAGTKDVAPPPNVRVYFIAGTQHAPARFPPSVTNGQQPDNAVNYWWTMRALLVAMHRWVAEGVEPPASRYPTLRDGTLVKAADVSFPEIPNVASPRALTAGARVANPLLARGAGEGAALPLLVPQVDADGNERAGIRLPDITVPLGTHTGWNFRSAAIGAPGDLVSLLGSSIPFPTTKAAREAAHDPRRSIAERYASRDDYLARVRAAADALVADRYLLAEDVPRVMQRAGEQWDLFMGRQPSAAR